MKLGEYVRPSFSRNVDDGVVSQQPAEASQLFGRIGGGPWFGVGAKTTVTAGDSGYIYLAYNDSAYSDNTGSYSATITDKST